MRMRPLLLIAFVGTGICADVSAQQPNPDEFKTAAARNAELKFLKALRSARDDYIKDLESAAKAAVTDDNLDEAVRIKRRIEDLKSQQTFDRGDAVVQLRRKLRNTTWTYNRPDKPETIQFLPKNRATLGTRGTTGVWEAIDSRAAIVNFDETMFLFNFDDKVNAYSIRAFGPVKTHYTTGKRIR